MLVLVHRLAQVGNPPGAKGKAKRLGRGKFKGGGAKGKLKGKNRSQSRGGGRKEKNHKAASKKHRCK